MAKKIDDYLHLYLGCECVITIESHKLFNVDDCRISSVGRWYVEVSSESAEGTYRVSSKEVKFKLRPLSSMTEEEFAVLLQRMDGADFEFNDLHYFNNQSSKFSPDAFLYLVSKGFDLFGLIEAGLAISSLNTKNNDK